jgi:hypothetical protein
MTFPINTGIPAASNDPSNDQPGMQTNFANIAGLMAVDHTSQGTTGAGTHKQVTFNTKNAAGAQTDPASTVYTGNGTASSVAQLFFRNQNRIFHLSPIRAWGYANTAGIIASQSFNITSVIRKVGFPTGVFTITMTGGATSSANYAVLVSAVPGGGSNVPVATFSIINTTQFDLVFRKGTDGTLVDPTSFSFQVMQI